MVRAYAVFDPANYLDSEAVISEYLVAAGEDANPEVFLAALDDVARARSSERGSGSTSYWERLG